MSHRWTRAVVIALVGLAVAITAVAVASATPAPSSDNGPQAGKHDLGSPLSDKQRALTQRAMEMKASGQIPANTKVAKVAKGQYVQLAREGEDSIWTVLGEFGTQIDSRYGGAAGPLHNQIPQPDRSVDNTTIWTPNFDTAHYQSILFSEQPGVNSMRKFYIENSSNRYAVNGDVTDWVQVPFNEARYGNNACGGIVCSTVWLFVRDSLTAWYNSQIAAGKTQADINQYLSGFDVWDRYDYDGDGNFNEPDGYIDHFQSVHAGEGEETGGGAQGTNAIWSHRWYAFFNLIGSAGPSFNKAGGLQIGTSNYWVGDYTIEPENGGTGVFSHEFAHDLGLPDEYDTSGNVGGAENSTAWWTIMSQGSYGTDGKEDLGTRPVHFNAWDKFQLGWLNYDVASAGDKKEVKLAPAEYNTKQAQGLFVVLPDKQVTVNLGAPYAGTKYYYSGSGNNLDNFMTRSVNLAAGSHLTAQVRYNTETDWDYAYVVVSTDGGTTWNSVPTNRSSTTNPNGQNFGQGITGSTGGNWVALDADLTGYSGNVVVGFRYWTDGATVLPGFQADEISVGGQTYGAEVDGEFTLDGFRVTTGTEQTGYFNAYVVENRQYTGFDDSLRTGPYNFGFQNTKPKWVEHFPYQDGILISYWDSSHTDNNVGDHPGEGLILPVDAHPQLLRWSDGTLVRPRIQSYDSTFGLEATDAITLHVNGVPTTFPSLPAVSVFDDLNSYWTPNSAAPGERWLPGWNSVNVPHTGTQVRVKSMTPGGFAEVEVRPSQ